MLAATDVGSRPWPPSTDRRGSLASRWSSCSSRTCLDPWPGGSRIVLEWLVDGNDAVDAKWAELVEAGYPARRAPFLTAFGASMGMVDDPDGNTVLITAG
jgi:hypothetical protein